MVCGPRDGRLRAHAGCSPPARRAHPNLELTMPSQDTPRIQEGHITMIHILCDLVERRMFGDAATKP